MLAALEIQPALPGIGLVIPTRYSLGGLGERWAAEMLRERGFHVTYTHRGIEPGDLRVVMAETGEVLYMEVKTARRAKDGKWRFTLWKKGCTDHRRAHVVLLLAVADYQIIPFIIPVDVLRCNSQAVITSHPERYTGKLAPYRRAWDRLYVPCAYSVLTERQEHG